MLNWALEFLQDPKSHLPEEFGKRLDFCLDMADMSVEELSRIVEQRPGTIRGWIGGKRPTDRNIVELVQRIEETLGVDKDTLNSALVHRWARRHDPKGGDASPRVQSIEFPRLQAEFAKYRQFLLEPHPLGKRVQRPNRNVNANTVNADWKYLNRISARLATKFGWGDEVIRSVSLAHLVFHEFVGEAIEEISRLRCERARVEYAEGVSPVTQYDLSTMNWIKLLVQPDRGYLCLNPHISVDLKPLPGLITADDVRAAAENWNKTCLDAWERWPAVLDAARRRVALTKPKFSRFIQIMQSEDPMTVFDLMERGLNKRIGSQTGYDGERAKAVRDRVLIGIASQCGFRINNYRQMRLHHLVEENGDFKINIAATEFKNGSGSAFKDPTGKFALPFDRKLSDRNDFFKSVRDYLRRDRKLLGCSDDNPYLFPGKVADGMMSASGIGGIFRFTTKDFLAGKEGFDKVEPFDCHGFRAILCCGVFRRSRGDRMLAARAIMDTVATAERYYILQHYADEKRELEGIIGKTVL